MNTYYRFLNDASFNWTRFLLLLSAKVTGVFSSLTRPERVKVLVSTTLKKLNSLSEETCAELTATTKRRKITERDHSIKTRLAKAKEQSKQPTVAEEKRHRAHSKGKGDMAL